MTRSIGIVDRIRWMSAMAASAVLAITLAAGLHQVSASAASAVQAAAPTTTAVPAGSSSPLDPRIAGIAGSHPKALVSAIIQFKANVSLDHGRWLVARDGGHVFAQLHIINALAAKLSAERARWLAANPDVHSVSLNSVVRSQSLMPIPSSQLSQLQTTYDKTLGLPNLFGRGYTGAGIGVAVIDTGVDGVLPDFKASDGSGSRVVETAVTNPYATNATDGFGHGTDVAGIVAGNGLHRSLADPSYGAYIGVAPNANLISVKVSDDQGNATVLDVIYGLQFAVDHKQGYNIRVINMSLDSTTPQSYTADPLDAAAESAWMHGIAVIVSAGNRGGASDAVQYAPANDPYVITVGAVDEHGQANPANDTIAPWSSRGTTQDGFQKPDVYAPGAHIVSVLAPNSVFASLCQICNGSYLTTSGTSMAAPMIAGLVADLLQYHPTLIPDQVKGALMDSRVSDNPTIQIPDAAKLTWLSNPPMADLGLTPNTLLLGPQGNIDYARSTWSRSTWSSATSTLSARFARSSWSCACSARSMGSIDPTRSTWSRSSWSTYFDTP